MPVYTNPPEWEAQGKKPPSSKRTEGWKPGDRVPASWLNWFWFSTANSLREIAQAFVSHRESTSGVHGVPKGETIATTRYVDGRLDAHIADKNNPHGVTAEQIGAAPLDAAVPRGAIIMWSGSIDSIPAGWALCDGRNGTPDLRDKFIVGAGSTYPVGATGGRTSHAHTYSGNTSTAVGGSQRKDNAQYDSAASLPSHYHTYSGTTSTESHLPPYYALAFIMKL